MNNAKERREKSNWQRKSRESEMVRRAEADVLAVRRNM
jgi:hypothetical protein